MTAPTMMRPMSKSHRIAVRVVAVIVAAGSVNAFAQCLNFLPAFGNDPVLLSLEQLIVGVAAAIATVGAWRYRAWAWLATLVYGLLTGLLIMSLPPLIDLEAEAAKGIWVGAAMVVAVCAALAGYLWFALTRSRDHAP